MLVGFLNYSIYRIHRRSYDKHFIHLIYLA